MSMIVHVGLHKTGTTFLQREIFPKIKNVNYNRDVFWVKNYKNKINVISNEWLSGQPYHGDSAYTLCTQYYRLCQTST